MNYILLAIPFFLLLICIELAVDRYRKTGFYRLNDSLSSLNAGTISRVNVIFRKLIPLAIYAFIEKKYALVNFQESTTLWIIAFVLYDFCYYWNHRMGHEINVLWASHVVHHSSEEYNLTTALRQTSGSILGWIFYIPMALLGIDPIMLATVGALNLLYQFWVHTRHIPKLGWYEWIFVTPSNHRVHHAINQQYIDRNYGGVFILWDKIFNTFQEELENEPCLYGIRKPLNSWNPIWANLHFYTQLAKDSWRAHSWKDKILIWFKPTGWRPADVEEKYPLAIFEQSSFSKFDIKVPTFNSWYSLFQYAITSVAIFLLLQNFGKMNNIEQLLSGSFILWGSYSIGSILEGRRWAQGVEFGRFLALVSIVTLMAVPDTLFLIIAIVSMVSLIGLIFIKPRQVLAVD